MASRNPGGFLFLVVKEKKKGLATAKPFIRMKKNYFTVYF